MDWTLWKGPMLEQCLKGCSLREEAMKDFILWEGPHAGADQQCEDKQAAQIKVYYLSATPTPTLFCLGREEVENAGVKWA